MATTYETMSKDEANSFLFGGQPQQQMAPTQAAPVETAPRKTKPIAPPAMGKPMVGDLNPQGLVSQVAEANKSVQSQTPAPQAPSVVGALIDQLTNNWQLPALGLAALAAAGYGGYKAGKGGEGLKSRDITQRIEPTMDGSDLSKPTPTAVPVPKEEPQTKFAKDFEIKYGVPLATAEEISGGKITKQWEADIVGNAIKNQLPITVKKEAPVIATTTTTQPATMAAPVAPTAEVTPPAVVSTGPTPEAAAEPIEKAETIKKAVTPTAEKTKLEGIAPTGMSPAGKTAMQQFEEQYPSIAKDLKEKGQIGLSGFGSGENNLVNTYGPEGRKAVLEYFNEGKPVGTYEKYLELNKKMKQGVPPRDVPGLMARLPAEAEAGNLGNLGTPASIGKNGQLVTGKNTVTKAIKAGGPALLLISAVDAANAATKGDLSPSKELGFDLATGAGLASLVGGPAALAGSLAFGSKGLNANEEKELAYRRKVGSGRGIAPPSAYMR